MSKKTKKEKPAQVSEVVSGHPSHARAEEASQIVKTIGDKLESGKDFSKELQALEKIVHSA